MRLRKRDLLLLLALLGVLYATLRRGGSPEPALPLPAPPSAPRAELERRGPFTVTRVLDGDTVKLDSGETVRLIGVDAPELHHPELPVQRFGQEAGDFLKRMLEGFEVTLEMEPAEMKDKYGRTLAYVWKGDRLANKELIRRGYAYAYTRFDFRRRDEFLALEKEARRAQYGLWHLSLRDGRLANLAARYDSLSLEGRKRLDEAMEQLTRQYPAEVPDAPAAPRQAPAAPALPAGVISWMDAPRFAGRRVTVEGRIVAARNTGKVCFLNFHKDYAKHLTAIVFASAFSGFPQPPETLFKGKRVQVTGTVARKDGRTEIVVEGPEQIRVVE